MIIDDLKTREMVKYLGWLLMSNNLRIWRGRLILMYNLSVIKFIEKMFLLFENCTQMSCTITVVANIYIIFIFIYLLTTVFGNI